MKTEFSIFRVKKGMEAEASTWMRLLAQRRRDCVQTLDREKIHYESVFRFERDGRLFLAWFSVQNELWIEVDQGSPFEIDRLHCEFWDQCVDPDFGQEDWEHVVSFIPPSVEAAIAHRDSQFASEPESAQT